MKSKVYSIVFVGFIFCVYFFSIPTRNLSNAQVIPAISLSVPTLNQHFYPADTNGDTGLYNCVPAAMSMALLYFSQADLFVNGSSDYASIRLTLRNEISDINRGISLLLIPEYIARLTDNAIRARIIQTSSDEWQQLLKSNLSLGLPIIVYIADPTQLPGHRLQSPFAHVIVVRGIDTFGVTYNDPWDGKSYTLPHEQFEVIWGDVRDPFFAVVFDPVTTLISDPAPQLEQQIGPSKPEKKFVSKKKNTSVMLRIQRLLGING
jgi:hypothetical protein